MTCRAVVDHDVPAADSVVAGHDGRPSGILSHIYILIADLTPMG